MTKESFEQYCFKKYCNCETHQEYTEFNKKIYIDEEYKIIKQLERKKILCDILNVRIINFNPNERVVIYNYFNNSLNELYGKLDFGICLDIL